MNPLLPVLLALFWGDSLTAPASPTPCPEAGGVRTLLKRLEILEKLVRDLKGQCTTPCCASLQSGADDPASLRSPPCPQSLDSCPGSCGGDSRGICVDGQCQCKDGYMGDQCELQTCPEDCHDQGRCVKGTCICFEGYFGPNCDSRTCPNNCQNHGRCEDGVCVCDPGYAGVDCSSRICPLCRNRGKCVGGVCVCPPGFSGVDCSSRNCPKKCLNRGRCENGVCVCNPGFSGPDCGSRTCPNDCHGHGRCERGVCVCDSGYTTPDCSSRTCLNNCQSRGRCEDGICVCDSGFTGLDCSSRTCLNDCHNRGRCEDGICVCDSGFTGLDCSSRTCPNDCQNRGRCEDGICVCISGFTGFDCSSKTCPNDCNDQGTCEDGACICDSGFFGPDCGSRKCPEDCNEQGQCILGVCVCEPGFVGLDCGTRICSPECERRGRCEDGECICDPGYAGPDCEIRTCPADCNKRGRCDDGKCVCDTGYTGLDCGSRTCAIKCLNKGRCEDGVCICTSGFTGLDCGSRSCPKNCSGNGQCINGKCVCDAGFSGPVCGTRTCPVGCTKHGRCVRGICVCSPGFTGPDCTTRLCPKNCNNQGRCEDGLCICDSGYGGLDCGSKTCPNNCHSRGQCDDGVCTCYSGYGGVDCASRTCPNDCNNRGECNGGECICDPGFTGLDCGSKTCPNDCNNRGQCVDGECICNSGFTGLDCGSRTCHNDCNDQGQCKDGKCICDFGFTGIDCGSRSCPHDCHNRGRCDDGECICDSGYIGMDCGSKTCPNNCYDQGVCDDGTCLCDSGYTGLDCGSRTCPNDCYNRGRCHDGQCICDSGYTDVDCGSSACPENCNSQGHCEDGVCVCDTGYTGPTCESRACPDNCQNRGRCENGICICQAGYTGLDCGSRACPKNCNDNGLCVNGKCICNLGFSGPVCGARVCPSNCLGQGRCVNGVCVCKKGYGGKDCGEVINEVTVVTGLRVTAQEVSAVTVDWDTPLSPPDSYEITFQAKKENGLISSTLDGSLTSYSQTGLAPGEEYVVSIIPRKGQSVGPEASITATTRIETPRGLRVIDVTTSALLLRWDRPQSLPERYIVILVAPSGKERKLRVPGRGDRVRVTGLEEGTLYRLILRAERGLEQSEGSETTASTAVGDDQKNPTDDQRTRRPAVISQTHGSTKKIQSSVDDDQAHPTSMVRTLSHVDDNLQTREVITEERNKKGGKVVHTTKKNVVTTIITTYHTHHREDGEVVDVSNEDEDKTTGQDNVEVTTLVEEEGDLGKGFPGDPIKRQIHTREKVPGHIVERWVVTRNITRFGTSGEETPSFLPEEDEGTTAWPKGGTKNVYSHLKLPSSQWEGISETSDVTAERNPSTQVGTSREKTTVNSNEEGFPIYNQEGRIQNQYTQTKSSPSVNYKPKHTSSRGSHTDLPIESSPEIDGEKDNIDDTTKSKKSTKVTVHRIVTTSRTKSVGKEDREHRNETGSEIVVDRILETGVRAKNQSRVQKTPIFMGSQIKSVIENLPEKLSLYNGTFIQRLESYLRATSYPLRDNQTVESVAKAIFLYLVKWKPQSFTGLVYDRLPQKTPGALGNPEPVGASRIRGNTASAILENTDDGLEEVTEKPKRQKGTVSGGEKPESSKIAPISSELDTLGRVEAAGEVEVPVSRTVGKYGPTSDITAGNNNLLNVIPSPIEGAKEDSPKTTPKTILDTFPNKEPQRKLPSPKKPPISEKKMDGRADQITDTEGMEVLDLEGEAEVESIDPKAKEYEMAPNRTKLDRSPNRPGETGKSTAVHPKPTPKRDHGTHVKPRPVKEDKVEASTNDENRDRKDQARGVSKQSPHHPLVEEPHHLRKEEEVGRDRNPSGGELERTKMPDEELRSVLLGKGEAKEDAREERTTNGSQIVGSTIEKDKSSPIKDPFSLRKQGPVDTGRPGILKKSPMSLVVSLESLGVLWDKVMVLYRQWPPTNGAVPQKLEVERGAREVEIGGLEPGTSYRIDLHGLVRGRSSKSYSLISMTAMGSTASVAKLTIPPTTPTTTEVITNKAPTVTKKPAPQIGALQVRDVTSESVTLVWKARPGTFETFLVRYEDVTDNLTTQETSVPGDQREVTLTGLKQDTRYLVSLYGVRGGKLSRPLKEEVTTEPSPDRGTPPRLSPISVSEVQPDSFLVSWEPIDGDFDAFVLQYGPPGGPKQETTLRGDETSVRLTGLVTAVNYTVEIRGIWGEKYSDPVTAYVVTAMPQPPRLESMSVSDVHSDFLLLSWDVQGGEFDSFLLSYRDAEGKPQEIFLEGDLRTVSVKDLRPGKKYKFILYGISGGKRGKPVTAETMTAKLLPPRLESLVVSGVHSESVDLSWVVQDGEFDTFLLTYRDAEGKSRETTLEGDLRTVAVRDLKPGKKYKFILYGISTGKRSKGVIAETITAPKEKQPPPSPITSTARLVDLRASEVGRDSVTLSWSVDGEPPFEWIVVQYREPEGGVRELQVPGGDTSTMVQGLLPSREYKFNVYGVRGDKRGKPLSIEVTTGYPEAQGQPSSLLDELFLSPRGPLHMFLSWEAPEGSFESFHVQYWPMNREKSLEETEVEGSARTLLLSGLHPDTLYNVTVSGVRGGREQGSVDGTGRTGPLELESPRSLRFNDVREESVTVSWDPSSPDTTTFKVSYQLADGGEPESISVVGTSTTLRGLTPGMRYEVTVVTVRGFEESQPLSGYTTTLGGGPHSLRALDVTEESALLRWDPPSGAVDKYLVTYRAENIPAVTLEVAGERSDLALSGLRPHTEYTASVQSMRGPKTSSPSSTSFTTSDDSPRDLSASQITAGSALLTWTAPQALPDGYLLTYHTPEGQMKEIPLLPNLSSFMLTNLTPLTLYRLQLRAQHGGASSAPISTSFTTARQRYPFPRDCWEQRLNGHLQSGLFNIYLGGAKDEPMSVYCDMETDGGGWIVFQRRVDGSVNFFRDWGDYKRGFGNMTSEFWLGNTALHRLSSSAPFELRVDLRAGDEAAYAFYDSFIVEPENQYFKLRLGEFRGDAGDSMSYHNNMIFSTRDRDAKKRILPCAMSYRGAWWYRNCHYANLNGMYGNNKDHQGINWFTWKGFEFSIPFTEMKMRPRGVGNRRRF